MLVRPIVGLAVLAVLAACSTLDRPPPGSSIQTPASQTRTEPPKEGGDREWMKPDNYRAGGPVPAMEDNRKINEQSCTEGIDLTAGNLKCR